MLGLTLFVNQLLLNRVFSKLGRFKVEQTLKNKEKSYPLFQVELNFL